MPNTERCNVTRIAIMIVSLLLGSLGCAGTASRAVDTYLFEILDTQRRTLDADPPVHNLAGLLPNQHIVLRDGTRTSMGRGVVIGEVTEVRAGHGFIETGREKPDGSGAEAPIVTSYSDPAAWWRTIEVDLVLHENWSSVSAARLTLMISAQGAIDTERFLSSLPPGSLVIAGIADSDWLPQAPEDSYTILLNGGALGVVDSEGRITMKAMGSVGETFLGELNDLVAVERQARRSVPDIVQTDDGWTTAG